MNLSDLTESQMRWVLYTILLGGTVVSFSNSALNPAIPVFMSTFSVDIVMGSWVLNGYVLAMSVGLMLSGYATHRFSLKYLYIFSIGLFSLGSVIGALSPNMNLIIAARVVQGLAGGMVIPMSIGLIYRIYPQEVHGRMMAVWGIVIMLSLAFGPLIGAYLVEQFAWWILFACTVPIACVVMLMSCYMLPKQTDTADKPFDWVGFLGMLAWLLALVVWVNQLKTQHTSWLWLASPLFAISAIAWWRYESSVSSPILDVTLFRNHIYLHSNIISVTQTVSLMLSLLLVPIIIQSIMGKSALWTGVVLMLSTLAASVTTHFAGKVVDSKGARDIGMIGIGIGSLSTLLFAYVLTSPTLWLVTALMICRGVGVGLAYLPTTTVGFSSLPKNHVTEGAAINNISRRIVSTISIAIATIYIGIRQVQTESMVAGIQEVFILTAILLICTLPSAKKLPKTKPKTDAVTA